MSCKTKIGLTKKSYTKRNVPRYEILKTVVGNTTFYIVKIVQVNKTYLKPTFSLKSNARKTVIKYYTAQSW